MQAYTGSEKIGEIVAGFPGASNVFKQYGIDFCCGGDRPLLEAIRKQKLNESEVLGSLNDAYALTLANTGDGEDWRTKPLTELIDHVVNVHHAFLYRELPVLGEFTTKILRVHGGHQPELLPKLHRLFHEVKAELERHMIDEEQNMFPLVKAYEQSGDAEALRKAVEALGGLEDDHSGVGDILKEIRAITDGFALPEWACRTYTLTFQKLEEMESDVFQHIHLENNILFPRVAEKLS